MTERPSSAPSGPGATGPAASPAGPALSDELRALRRSQNDRIVAGVLGGLGARLGIDPVLLRVAVAVLALFGGVGVLLYAVGWLLIPAEGDRASILEQSIGRQEVRDVAAVPLALGLGVVILISSGIAVGASWNGRILLVLAILGVIVMLRRRGDETDAPNGADGDNTPPGWGDRPGTGPWEPVGEDGGAGDQAATDTGESDHVDDAGETDAGGPRPSHVHAASVSSGIDGDMNGDIAGAGADGEAGRAGVDGEAGRAGAEGEAEGAGADPDEEPVPASTDEKPQPTRSDRASMAPATAAGPYDRPGTGGYASGWPEGPDWDVPMPDPAPYAQPAVAPEQESEGTTRSILSTLTLCVALVAVGVLATVDATTAAEPGGLYLAVPLAVIGTGLLVGAWFGRARGLIGWGVVASLALAPSTLLAEWDTVVGRHAVVADADPATLPTEPVSHGVGRLDYDLGALELEAGETVDLTMELALGSIEIVVPDDVHIVVDGAVGMGNMEIFDETYAGVGQERDVVVEAPPGTDGGTIELAVNVGLGNIEIHRAGDGAQTIGESVRSDRDDQEVNP